MVKRTLFGMAGFGLLAMLLYGFKRSGLSRIFSGLALRLIVAGLIAAVTAVILLYAWGVPLSRLFKGQDGKPPLLGVSPLRRAEDAAEALQNQINLQQQVLDKLEEEQSKRSD
jgi:hypothetical protein